MRKFILAVTAIGALAAAGSAAAQQANYYIDNPLYAYGPLYGPFYTVTPRSIYTGPVSASDLAYGTFDTGFVSVPIAPYYSGCRLLTIRQHFPDGSFAEQRRWAC